MELMEDRIYGIIYYFPSLAGNTDWIAPKNADTLVLDKFSKQYLSLIMIIPLYLFASIKNLSFIIKIAALGSISFMLYLIFIFT